MKTLWTIDDDIEVEVSHYYAGRPARLSGPPEDCYEAEAEEVDISAVYVCGCDVSKALNTKAWDRITELVLEKIKDKREADDSDPLDLESSAIWELTGLQSAVKKP